MLPNLWRLVLRESNAKIRALSPAAIILGSVLNLLEAVSFGLLIFPPSKQDDAFTGLETQAISLYIMSTVVSQTILSLGGWTLPPVLSSMIAELLPFLRSIASGIQKDLGVKHPGVLPTTMVAFAMASMLIGVVFLLLAALRCGNLIGYFPQTVIMGVNGAVGVSLSVFALEITFPAPSRHLTFTTLFSTKHLPLLAASAIPALLICTAGHVNTLDKRLNGFPSHPLYVPICCFGIAVSFWVVVAAGGSVDLAALESARWLFKTRFAQSSTRSSASWNYWALFNFSKVEWSALSGVAGDISLLVFIGVLTLPIFASMIAIYLEAFDHSMRRELLGHGVLNVLIAPFGGLPATMIYSNTRMFNLARGKREDAIVVSLISFAFFFTSVYVLPYVPTILASALVLYIGLELMIEALWQSSGSMVWSEWVTVASTTIGCTFLGFAQGIALGLAVEVTLHFLRDSFSSRPRFIQPCAAVDETIRQNVTSTGSTFANNKCLDKEFELPVRVCKNPAPPFHQLLLLTILFTNRVNFTNRSLITQFIETILDLERPHLSSVILDFHRVVTLDTCTEQHLAEQARRLDQAQPPVHILITGAQEAQEIHKRLVKRGLRCGWASENSLLPVGSTAPIVETASAHFKGLIEALELHLPRDNLSIEDFMNKYGLTICELSPEQAVSCGRYACKPKYLVLQGEVMIQYGHDEPDRTQQPFRSACWEAINEAIQWCSRIIHQKSKPHAAQHTHSKRLTSLDVWDKQLDKYTCAHAVSDPCWILFVDPKNMVVDSTTIFVDGEKKKHLPLLRSIAS